MKFYIDPGTGSMLFTILIGIIGTAIYAIRMFLIKFKFYLSGGKASVNDDKIPFVIFSDDKRYWRIFESICRKFDERGIDVVYMTASEDDPAFDANLEHLKVEFIGEDNKAFAKLNFLKANIVFSTTPGLDVYQWKRSKEVDYYVHILHAPSESVLYRMFGIDYYDAVLLSGEYQAEDIRFLEEKRNLPAKDLKIVGIPYMDDMAAKLEKFGKAEAHERTVLLAPSWGQSAIFGVYGEKIIEVLLKTGYHIIVRPHPQSFKSEKEMLDNLMQKFPESSQLEWNSDVDNFDVLNRSDILISDFSGVVYDFALIYDKPIIYTNPDFDLSVYDAWWLEKPIWTTTALPRLGKELTEENMDNLKELIDACIEDTAYAKSRQEVKDETWQYVGEGAERTAQYLIEKYEEITNGKGEN